MNLVYAVLTLSIVYCARAQDKRGFYAWPAEQTRSSDSHSGHRSIEPVEDLHRQEVTEEEKRKANKNKFYSWYGKRSEKPPGKFYSWYGKRSDELEESNEDKRGKSKGKFYSWYGKRDGSHEVDSTEKRNKAKFYSWYGKRSDSTELLPNEDDRGRFYSWYGKKDKKDFGSNEHLKEEKRFYNWNSENQGKREEEDKRFYNWHAGQN